jgi:hypothetical protein
LATFVGGASARRSGVEPRWGRAGLDEVAEDPEDLLGIGDDGEDPHLGTTAGTKELVERILEQARAVRGVLGLNDVTAHYVGTSVEIEVHIDVDDKLSVTDAHDIATEVRDRIEGMEEVSRAFIHVDPLGAS